MSNIPNAIGTAAPGGDQAQISDDECLKRLSEAVRHHEAVPDEAEPIDEVAFLIGRLAVAIE